MGMPDSGYFFYEPGQVLAYLTVVEVGDIMEGTQVETLFQPTRDDIKRICKEWKFDFEKTMELIEDRDPAVHSMFIDAKKYRGD